MMVGGVDTKHFKESAGATLGITDEVLRNLCMCELGQAMRLILTDKGYPCTQPRRWFRCSAPPRMTIMAIPPSVQSTVVSPVTATSAPAATSVGDVNTTASISSNKALTSLSEEDVLSIMVCLKMKKFIEAFREMQVDGECLASSDSVSDIGDLGVSVRPKAKILFDRIQVFKVDGVPAELLGKYNSVPTPTRAPIVTLMSDKV
jgi:hypothetical protein